MNLFPSIPLLHRDDDQALALTRAQRYAVILMDMQMLVLNGVEVTQAIRADSLNRDRSLP